MKYVKKPVVIQAFQMTQEHYYSESNWPAWLTSDRENGCIVFREGNKLAIFTLEGVMNVDVNDWVIKGVKNELYPCKPDIFAATYDLLEEEQ